MCALFRAVVFLSGRLNAKTDLKSSEMAGKESKIKHRHAKRARVIFLVIGSRSIRRTVHSNDLVKFFWGVAMYSKKETGNL